MNRRLESARIVPAIGSHVADLAPRLRGADRREIRAAFGRPAAAILGTGFRNARRCWTVVAGRRPVAMFGVGRRTQPRVGTAWLLASEEFGRFHGQLRREGPYWVDVLMVGHDVLANFVLAENRLAIRWLTWLGFELLVLHRGAGLGGEDFWEFAAFRAGTRERYLSHAARSASPVEPGSSPARAAGPDAPSRSLAAGPGARRARAADARSSLSGEGAEPGPTSAPERRACGRSAGSPG